jgi:DNA-binding transcriptional ArsR family regulator
LCDDLAGGLVVDQGRRAQEDTLREMARYFYALKDVMRLRILAVLADTEEMTVSELARALRASQPLVSFHLRPLRTLGLISVRRAGREAFCSLDMAEIRRRHDEFIWMLSHPVD